MNVIQVKLLLDAFDIRIDKVIGELDSLPMSIVFYDTDGAQLGAYKNVISSVKKLITDNVLNIKSAINDAMESESKTILLAKDRATQTLAS